MPNGHRRAKWHDYYDRSIYLITLNAAPGIPPFSHIQGIVGNHDWVPKAVNTPLGNLIGENISALKLKFPFTKILRRVIMPEHVHFVLFVTEKTEYHLGHIISHLKGECTRRFNGYDTTRANAGNLILPPLFEEDYHERILTKQNQLDRILAYVSDNPRRRLIRMQNPDFFSRKTFMRFEDGIYEAYGNIHLLNDPDIEAVKVSSKFTAEELHQRKICWLRTVENCGVLASPFISKDEKRVRDWAIDNGGRLIWLLDNGFGPRFTPKGIMHQLCAEGRMLLIAPAEHSTAKVSRNKGYWERMNRFAVAISQGQFMQ